MQVLTFAHTTEVLECLKCLELCVFESVCCELADSFSRLLFLERTPCTQGSGVINRLLPPGWLQEFSMAEATFIGIDVLTGLTLVSVALLLADLCSRTVSLKNGKQELKGF